jgi:F-box-like
MSDTAEADLSSRTVMLPIHQAVHEQHSAREDQSLDQPGRYNHLYGPFMASLRQSTPIHRLPVELLLLIFRYGKPQIKERLKLTHICRRWREVTIDNASLWISITIPHDPKALDERFQSFVSLLEMQLELTKALPLDVEWHISGSPDRISVVIDLLQRKGPFHRWRSLTLSLVSVPQEVPSPAGEFSNLESLTVLQVHDHPILQMINLTTTSKLRTLDLDLSHKFYEDINDFFGTILKRITSLVLSDSALKSLEITPLIPANITTLEDTERRMHPFPYVKTYKLAVCFFTKYHVMDLQGLTTLIITGQCGVTHDCQVILPSLRHFACGAIFFEYHAVLGAPVLEALEFNRNTWTAFPSVRPSSIIFILDEPGFLLNPSHSLSLDVSLSTDRIIKIITRYSQVEKVQIYLDSGVIACGVVAAFAGKGKGIGFPCPRLTELRLKFGRDCRGLHDFEWWAGQAAQIMEERRCLAIIPRVYGSWDDGDTYILLA